ncbi:MAG: hypothetical protein RBR42_12640 [Desulfomicrobium sp.]|nr:hypothetical protein [Desulfomicrobium sp.]
MGTDAGWHLRFSRTDKQVFWVKPEVVPQLEHVLYIETDWTLALTTHDQWVRAEFTRKVRS